MQICRIFWKFNLQIVKFFTFKQLELFSKFLILRGKKLNIKLALYILSLVNLVASNDSSTLKPSSNQAVQSRQISTMSPISMRFDRTNLAQKKSVSINRLTVWSRSAQKSILYKSPFWMAFFFAPISICNSTTRSCQSTLLPGNVRHWTCVVHLFQVVQPLRA